MALTRREAIGLLGAGAAWGGVRSAEAFALRDDVFARQASPSPIIRTLLKDVAPGTIDGPILFHELLSIRYPLTRALAEAAGRPVPVSFTDDVELMIEETKAAGVDGVHIVASGGFYMQRNYPPRGGFCRRRECPADIAAKSADQIGRRQRGDAAAHPRGQPAPVARVVPRM